MSDPNMYNLNWIRQKLMEEGSVLEHPTKVMYSPSKLKTLQGQPRHRYGKIIYYDDGRVGGKWQGDHMIAVGPTHADSMVALAHVLGFLPGPAQHPVHKVSADVLYREAGRDW